MLGLKPPTETCLRNNDEHVRAEIIYLAGDVFLNAKPNADEENYGDGGNCDTNCAQDGTLPVFGKAPHSRLKAHLGYRLTEYWYR
ncbi:MAG: hypothetical protein R2688_00065 [Fimbriimonadaceae bacterium]